MAEICRQQNASPCWKLAHNFHTQETHTITTDSFQHFHLPHTSNTQLKSQLTRKVTLSLYTPNYAPRIPRG